MIVPSIRRVFAKSRFRLCRHVSSSSFPATEAFDPPPVVHARRVVVTGLGMVTPLGCGVKSTWKSLIEGGSGIRKLSPEDLQMNAFDQETQLHTYDQLTSKVAAVVPCGTKLGEFDEELWLNSKVKEDIPCP